MEIITLGIGTPSSIPTFILVGLAPAFSNYGGTLPAQICGTAADYANGTTAESLALACEAVCTLTFTADQEEC